MAEAPHEEVAQLRGEVERLRSENAELARRVAWRARLRRAALVFLLVFGCGLAGASVVAIWTRVTVLNTEQYVKTMGPIAESPAVQQAVSDKLYAAITSQVDFDALARGVCRTVANILGASDNQRYRNLIRSQLKHRRSDGNPQRWDEADAASARAGDDVAHARGRIEAPVTLEGDTVYLDLQPRGSSASGTGSTTVQARLRRRRWHPRPRWTAWSRCSARIAL